MLWMIFLTHIILAEKLKTLKWSLSNKWQATAYSFWIFQNDLTIVKDQFTVELKQIASQYFEL